MKTNFCLSLNKLFSLLKYGDNGTNTSIPKIKPSSIRLPNLTFHNNSKPFHFRQRKNARNKKASKRIAS